MDSDPVLDAFLYFYHVDQADAMMRHEPVAFAPLTLRLGLYLEDQANANEDDILHEVAQVRLYRESFT